MSQWIKLNTNSFYISDLKSFELLPAKNALHVELMDRVVLRFGSMDSRVENFASAAEAKDVYEQLNAAKIGGAQDDDAT